MPLHPFYSHELRGLVQLARGGRVWTIVWRGPLLVQDPATGVVRRVPVYRLDNGHWDAYYPDEFQSLGQWH